MKRAMRKKTATLRTGIDFGTTQTVVSLADSGNYPVLRLPFDHDGATLAGEHTPSCIASYRGRLYYGPAAKSVFRERMGDGAVMVRSLKRLLRDWHDGRRIVLGTDSFSIQELLTGFLSEIRRSILKALDLRDAVIETVIAVPANAPGAQRYVTLACFREAGFQVRRILDEPCASSIQFVKERYKRWDRVHADVIVYDLGGGTFDATLLAIHRERHDPLLSHGIARLGGDDFDEVLLDLVQQRTGLTWDEPHRTAMLDAVRTAKERISPYTKNIYVETGDDVVTIPASDYEDALDPLITRTIALLDKVLTDGTVGRAFPDRIVVVGGGSLLHYVPKKLRNRFGRGRVHLGMYPFASVAMGAAIQAEWPDIEVRDRLTRYFGVIRVREDGSEYLDVIFPKGQDLPRGDEPVRVVIPPYDPRYNIGRFQYLECDEIDPATGRPAGDSALWNEILFPYDPAIHPDGYLPQGLSVSDIQRTDHLKDERIAEEYSLDRFGIVTVRISRTVRDRFSNCYNIYKR